AFLNCRSLQEVVFAPNSKLTSIGSHAFSSCMGISSFEIPAGVTKVGTDPYTAFTHWTENQTIIVKGFASQEEADEAWGSKWRYTCRATIIYEGTPFEMLQFQLNDDGMTYTVWGKSEKSEELTEIEIPATYNGLPVTIIGDDAFSDCTALTNINIPEGVTNIGDNAFRDCISLTSVTLPESVTSISRYAFYNCTSLVSINLPEGITSIERKVFAFCTSLASIILPEGITSIGNGAFRECTSLTSITIPEGVTSIGGGAFAYCTSLVSIILPEGITSIGIRVFYRCTSLESINLPEGITNIGAGAFENCTSLASITIPASVIVIDGWIANNETLTIGWWLFIGWTEEQTIIVKGFASEEEADEAWGADWRECCNATIIYEGASAE
ncbi:MAG: leucine-rich repeat domain-containing protein, partial [Clostridiales bacterium]|nr:leucine-rich repeat domain-containing protein [Clostridiales bacterium]